MTQPMDRHSEIQPQGEVDVEAGEFWVSNPFLMQSNGQNLSAFELNKMYLNSGEGNAFLDVSFASMADIDSDSRSVVAADFDRDGAADLLVGSAGGGPMRLFLNRFPERSRTQIDLQGIASNRSAIGARVVVACGERRITRDLFACNGHNGQGPPQLLIGLGDAERIDALTVRWPGGESQTFRDLPVNHRIAIEEGRDEVDLQAFSPRVADSP